MSDTPRIDAAEVKIKSAGPCLVKDVCTIDTARRIERELNAANARIKRLEEYIARLEEVGDYWIPADITAWRQAKEAKP